MKNDNKGFSLIELIVVIAIMAILVGAMAPQVTKYIDKARKSTDTQMLGALYTAVQTAIADPDVVSKPVAGSLTIGTDGKVSAATTTLMTSDVLKIMGISNATDLKVTSKALKPASGTNTITVSIDPSTEAVTISVPLTDGSGKHIYVSSSGSTES